MSPVRQEGFRRKLDVFVWRVHQRMLRSIANQAYDKLDIHLNLLYDYMHECPTRVMASQVRGLSL